MALGQVLVGGTNAPVDQASAPTSVATPPMLNFRQLWVETPVYLYQAHLRGLFSRRRPISCLSRRGFNRRCGSRFASSQVHCYRTIYEEDSLDACETIVVWRGGATAPDGALRPAAFHPYGARGGRRDENRQAAAFRRLRRYARWT